MIVFNVVADQIPRSNAKTAYELLADVCEVINLEPKRVDMKLWRSKRSPVFGGPSCATVGCIAGWVNLVKGLSGPDVVRQNDEDVSGDEVRALDAIAGRRASTVRRAGRRLFHGLAPYTFPDEMQGTALYAADVIANLRRFMTRHQKALKARRLRPAQ